MALALERLKKLLVYKVLYEERAMHEFANSGQATILLNRLVLLHPQNCF